MTKLSKAAWVLLLVALLLPTVSAKGILEDSSRYPPGVTGVTRTYVLPGEDFSVLVNTNATFDQAAMVICRFKNAGDAEPNVCWSQIAAKPVEDVSAFTADSSGGAHPKWEDGWVIGYKLTLKGPAGEAHVPATGGEYYKVLVEPLGEVEPAQYNTTKAAPFCSLCFVAIGLALVVRRRFDGTWG